jgi:hypothetical protein
MADSKTRLHWALEIAARGFYIFPLLANCKVPDLSLGSTNALRTRDPDTIRRWFEEFPNMNYAVNPGADGAILDCDQGKKGKHGVDDYDALERTVPLDEQIRGLTFEVKSPSGGVHLYVLTPIPVTNKTGFGKDIEVRGTGGYVVGPGCYFDKDIANKPGDVSGEYVVVNDAPFIAAPPWQIDRMQADGLKRERKQLVEEDLPGAIIQGKEYLRKRGIAVEGCGGDRHTFDTCCVLVRDYGLSEDKALELLTDYEFIVPSEGFESVPQSWNDRCMPPWDIDDLRAKVDNAARYGTGDIGAKGGDIFTQDMDPSWLTHSVDLIREEMRESTRVRSDLEKGFLRGQEIWDKIKQPSWIVPHWMLSHGIHAVVGERGIGKTTIMMDLALRLAHGMDWHGTQMREDVTVVYICGEDQQGAVSQQRAWCQLHTNGEPPDPDRFIFAEMIMPLDDANVVAAWAEALRASLQDRPAVLFLDTWQRAIAKLSQNEDSDMQMAVAFAEAVGKAVNAPFVISYHPPKANPFTIAGSAVQENTTVAIWLIAHNAQGVELKVDRIRGEGKGMRTIFRMDKVYTGEIDSYFKFPLKHIVPMRCGGDVINARGDIYSESNVGDLRAVIVPYLAHLEANIQSEEPSASRGRGITLSQAAERIVGGHATTCRHPPLFERPDEESQKLAKEMRAAGLVYPQPHITMLELLRTITREPFTLSDGAVLTVNCEKNGAWRVNVSKAPSP